MASDIWPMPPRRAASSASSEVEMSTPIPPIMMGTNSLLPRRRRKSSTRFIAILKTPFVPTARQASLAMPLAQPQFYLKPVCGPHPYIRKNAAAGCGRRVSLPRLLIAEIIKFEGEVGHVLAQHRHGGLQIVPLGARDAHGVALDAGLHLHLAVLDDPHNFLRVIRFNTVFHLDDLLDLVAADFLDLAFVEEAHVDLALGQLVGEHVAHLVELELGVGVGGDLVLF